MTKLEVANLALSKLNAIPMGTWDDTGKNATQIKLHYNVALEAVCKEVPWVDLLEVEQLGGGTEENGTNFRYEYYLPEDCLKLYEVDGYAHTPFKRAKDRLYCNVKDPFINYVQKPDDDDIPDQIGSLVAMLLAFHVAPSITSDHRKAGLVYEQYQLAMASAVMQNQMQLGGEETSPGWWIDHDPKPLDY